MISVALVALAIPTPWVSAKGWLGLSTQKMWQPSRECTAPIHQPSGRRLVGQESTRSQRQLVSPHGLEQDLSPCHTLLLVLYREQEYRELCVATGCDHFANAACQRCGNVFCDAHSPSRHRRCKDCEEEFAIQHPVVGLAAAFEHAHLDGYKPKRWLARRFLIGASLTVSSIYLSHLLAPTEATIVFVVARCLAVLGVCVGAFVTLRSAGRYLLSALPLMALNGGSRSVTALRGRLRRHVRSEFLKERKPNALAAAERSTANVLSGSSVPDQTRAGP